MKLKFRAPNYMYAIVFWKQVKMMMSLRISSKTEIDEQGYGRS